jgi:hypothetical protein
MEDEGKPVPAPSRPEAVSLGAGETLALVEVDFDDYRRKHDTRTVKKNCTIPSWLNEAAIQAGLNFSKVLQDGLKTKLGIL